MKSSYNTQQKTAILDCLKDNAARQYTIEELLAELGDKAPGRSSAYRIIKNLCDEGLACRQVREGTRKAVYQAAGTSCCSEHLHIKCLNCGMLIHLDESAADELCKKTGFVIDDMRSMLYGRCAKCVEAGK